MEKIIKFLFRKRIFFIFLCIFGIGIFLRLYHLGFNSLWLDEAFVFKYAQLSLSDIWIKIVIPGVEFNPPFYYWIIHLILPFGKSEWLLRLPAALAGIFTIPVFYFIGKQVNGPKLGLALASLLSFSPYHIYYSQEARTYTLMLLFFSLALLFYLKTIKNNNLKNWLLFSFFSALALWSHYYVSLIIAVLFFHAFDLIIFKYQWEKLKQFFASLFLFLILSFPLIIIAGKLFLSPKVAAQPSWGAQGWGIISSIFISLSGYSQWLVVICLILLILGFSYFKKQKPLITLIIISLIIPLALSYWLSFKMPMNNRYLIFLLPIFLLGVCLPIAGLMKKNTWAGIIVLGVIILLNINYYSFYYHYSINNDWRGFAQLLSKITKPGDYVVSVPNYTEAPLTYYYSAKKDHTKLLTANNSKELENIESHNNIWFVITGHIRAANPQGDALKWINDNTQFQGKYMGISLFVK